MVPERPMEGQNQYRKSVKRSGSSGSGGSEPGENAGMDPDPEHYHILSYFMAGDTGSNAQSHINGGFVTAEASGDAQSGSRKRGMSGSLGKRSDSSSSLNQPSNEPPPTPAIQFYGHSSLSQSAPTTHSSGGGGGSSPGMSSVRAPPLTASSSSSSLSSMAAALVSGGTMPAHSLFNASGSNRGKDSPLSPSMMHTSPLSPAAVIGPGQENLMLPPPPRFPKNASGTKPASSQTEISAHPAHDPERKQMHMAWLQHLNSMAMRANPQQQQQQQQGMQPALTTNAAAMPGYAASATMPPQAAAGAPLAPTPVYSLPVPMPQQHQQPSMGESEERRARRLKRNRESARQSRRRKKEHLLKLEKQVNGLHTAIETERRRQIASMEPSLVKLRQEQILTAQGGNDELTGIVQNTGPNCAARRAIVNFQYNALRQWLLPKYQEFILWLTLHPEPYFLAGKEERAKNLAATQATRVSSGRVSSKQIGEEITNEFKKHQKTLQKEKEATTAGGAASPTPSNSSSDGNSNKGYITSKAFDAARMWPLLCYELSVSVDQEERLLQAHKKTRQLANLADKRSQMAVATRMSANMRNGVLYQAHTADHRSQSSLLHVLSPNQTLAFLKWFSANREKCRSVLQGHQHAVERKQKEEGESLSEVCRKLERVLRIPENDVVVKKEE